MKAVAFANNDMVVVAWTLGGKLPNCLGFAISHRRSRRNGDLPARDSDIFGSAGHTGTHNGRRSSAESFLEGRLRQTRRHLQV